MNNEKVKFLLNWNHFGDHLSSCMTKLMTDISYSDIIIATADKHMIYSHRFVLANSSKYFQRLLKQLKQKSNRDIQLVVALPEIKYEIFKILMNYMYKGETQVPHELLPSVIKAGQFLEINGLVNLSSESESGNGSGNTGNNSNLTKANSSVGESQSRCSIIQSSNCNGNSRFEEPKKSTGTPTLRDKVQWKENANSFSKVGFRSEKRTRAEKTTSDSQAAGENGKENRNKLAKVSKSAESSHEDLDFIQLPLKRKLSARESIKKISSPSSSSSTDNLPTKKPLQRSFDSPEVFPVKVKSEKGNNEESAPSETKKDELEDINEKITIKVEEPDEIEEVEYNELQCEFCHEVYTNPSDWVKHMTEQHEDRGYQAYKDLDKSGGGNTVITCVVCSCVCFSAAEWANHLRMWHTERELAAANMSAPKKTSSKLKKKSGSNKKAETASIQ